MADMLSKVAPQWALKRRMAAVQLAALNTTHKGASTTRRSLWSWIPGLGSANAETEPERGTLTARSRDAYRNQPLARAVIGRARSNVIGTGLRHQANIDAKSLGISSEEAADYNDQIEREFRLWAESSECDIERTDSFYQLQSLALVSALVSGDVFVNTPFLERPGSIYGLKLQMVEADRICNRQRKPDSERLVAGIQFDRHGAPLFYNVLKSFPGNPLVTQERWDTLRVFGQHTGRRRVMHVLWRDRPGQARGIPFIAPILEPLKQLDRYSDAELAAAVVAGMFTVFIRSDMGDTQLQGLSAGQSPESYGEEGGDIKLGNAAVVGLAPGESVDTANPGRPNTAFEPFVSAILRQIGAALEIPMDELMLDYRSSYSAARAAMLQAWKFYNQRRTWFALKFCQPIYELWFDEAVARGRITAPGYDDPALRAAWTRAKWIGPARGAIDEEKEVNAAIKRIEAGISTIDDEATEMKGTDFDTVHERRVREQQMRKAGGLLMNKTSTPDPASEGKPTDDDSAPEKEGDDDAA